MRMISFCKNNNSATWSVCRMFRARLVVFSSILIATFLLLTAVPVFAQTSEADTVTTPEPISAEESVLENGNGNGDAPPPEVLRDELVTVDDLGATEARILPDSPFHFFKRLGQNVQEIMTLDPIKDAELKFKHANQHLFEIHQLAEEKGFDHVTPGMVSRFEGKLDNAAKSAKKLKEIKDEDPIAVEIYLNEFTDKQFKGQQMLDNISNGMLKEIERQKIEDPDVNVDRLEDAVSQVRTTKEEAVDDFANTLIEVEDSAEAVSIRISNSLEKQEGSVSQACSSSANCYNEADCTSSNFYWCTYTNTCVSSGSMCSSGQCNYDGSCDSNESSADCSDCSYTNSTACPDNGFNTGGGNNTCNYSACPGGCMWDSSSCPTSCDIGGTMCNHDGVCGAGETIESCAADCDTYGPGDYNNESDCTNAGLSWCNGYCMMHGTCNTYTSGSCNYDTTCDPGEYSDSCSDCSYDYSVTCPDNGFMTGGGSYDCNYSTCPNSCIWDSSGCPSGCYEAGSNNYGSCSTDSYSCYSESECSGAGYTWCNNACYSDSSHCSGTSFLQHNGQTSVSEQGPLAQVLNALKTVAESFFYMTRAIDIF